MWNAKRPLPGGAVFKMLGRLSFVLTGQRAQAACADVNAAHLAVDEHSLALNVRAEHAIGRPLGVTDIMSEHRAFTTDFTLSH